MKALLKYLIVIMHLTALNSIYANEIVAPQQAPLTHFSSNNGIRNIAEFKGKKTLLWLFSTWCHTCAAGVRALADNHRLFNASDFTIIALRNYKNGGYDSSDINDFILHFSPQADKTQKWIKGDASEEMNKSYNARQYPDIYFLIDEQGIIQEKGTAPGVFINNIIEFAQNVDKP